MGFLSSLLLLEQEFSYVEKKKELGIKCEDLLIRHQYFLCPSMCSFRSCVSFPALTDFTRNVWILGYCSITPVLTAAITSLVCPANEVGMLSCIVCFALQASQYETAAMPVDKSL